MHNVDKLLNIILFPRELYLRITGKRPSLYMGILFIGLKDVIFVLLSNYKDLFIDKIPGDMPLNIFLSIIFIVGMGILDVCFFSIPLFDLYKRFKKIGSVRIDRELLVKLMKVYIVAHFVILPAEIFIFILFWNSGNGISTFLFYLSGVLYILIPIWFSAAISRGVDTLYNFVPFYKWLSFGAILVWNHLLGYAFSYIIESWILPLFRY
ncbi:MAG: hypothetical protein GX754_11900 [Clostridiaceae bacterium]|nr:hypothetical protein [Clostridiaceae bacterium]